MKFLRDILSRKAAPGPAAPYARPRSSLNPNDTAVTAIEALKRKGGKAVQEHSEGSPKLSDMVGNSAARSSNDVRSNDARPRSTAPVNIWDLADESPAAYAPSVPPADTDADAAMRRRQNRTKTRVLSFEPKDDSVSDLFKTAGTSTVEADKKATVAMFPTGWLLVVDGPGRGASFPLNQGMSQIGRGSDQTVCLDFGDSAISRTYHAAIAFDTASNKFHVGHGGKSNLVRLNDKPLLSTEMIADGDTLQIGETILILKVLCNESFNWGKTQPEGDSDAVALT